VTPDVWATISAEAANESSLWAGALRPEEEREAVPVFSPLSQERYALGLETIYEGYLLHYGRSRLFDPDDRDAGILLGDYLYAHGLVRIAALGDVRVVFDLAELISLCSQLRAEPVGPRGADAEAWAATAAALGETNGRLETARAALRDEADPEPLARLARDEAGPAAVSEALRLHDEHVL
jgi:hypothetical protein